MDEYESSDDQDGDYINEEIDEEEEQIEVEKKFKTMNSFLSLL